MTTKPFLRLVSGTEAAEPTGELGPRLREHEPVLQAAALRLCRDPHEAGDLVQDCFERALRSPQAQRADTNLRAWLLTVLRNLFIDRCRKRVREPRAEAALEVVDVPAAPPSDPEPRWARVTADDLRAAIDQLPPEFASVYRLHALEGRSYAEIAAALRIPGATVGTRLLRARQKLKKLLLPQALDEEDEP